MGDAVGEAVEKAVGEVVGDAVGDAVGIGSFWKVAPEKKTEKKNLRLRKSCIVQRAFWHLRSLKMACAILKLF